MKHFYLSVLLISTISIGCSKVDIELSPPPPPKPITLQVLEKATGTPISEATVSILKCAFPDYIFACSQWSVIGTSVTSNNGTFSYSPGPIGSVEAFDVDHPNYHSKREERMTNVNLTPKSIIQVFITRVNDYSQDNSLIIAVSDPSYYWIPRHREVGLPKDTVVYINGYGNSNNNFSWHMKNSSPTVTHEIPSFYVNRFDTTKIEIKY